MAIVLRPERKEDYYEAECLTREAFWRENFDGGETPGCGEHLMLHQLRGSADYLPELDLVAVEEASGTLVGNIAYTRVQVEAKDGSRHEMLTFGPLSVLPGCQNQGVGSLLVQGSIERAAAMGYRGLLIFGHPTYYPRFGFQNAADFGITRADGTNSDSFMALELCAGGFDGVHGRYVGNPAYQIHRDELVSFDRLFPAKDGRHVELT